ncbi:MAG: hypothetical protein IKL07_01300 [Clostridium sp.]|nr:hypothetical protein [Clostridium sp.]
MHDIYNAEVHIELDKIEDIIQRNSDKTIICFGGGTAASILMKRILYKYNVACFLDNNKKLHGTTLMGKEICSPEILETMRKNSFIVLILSKHYEVIGRQLEGYGLQEGIDYFNIYNQFRDYFYIMKFDDMGQKFLSFVERIPRDMMKQIPVHSEKKIGIICSGTMEKNVLWFALGQYLILRYRGYNPTLIVDNMNNHDNYIYFSNYRDIVTNYLDYALDFMKEYFGELKVQYIDSEKKAKLDKDDEQFIEKMSGYSLRWLDSRYDESFLEGAEHREEIAREIMKNNLMSLKAFFCVNEFEVISIYTGMHKHRGLYLRIGELYDVRVCTYDGSTGDLMLIETDGVSSHSYDIRRIFAEHMFDDQEREQIIKLGQKGFEKRIHSTAKDGDYNYQLVGEGEDLDKTYDVIMPLNIFWDSAALGVDRLFSDYVEWINETLLYLMEQTDVSVMIREHPAQNALPSFKYDQLADKIPLLHRYKDRIFFCKAEQKINTYQYMKHCKLVLPYTSTIGLEAVIMGIPIVTHTSVYYGAFSFGNAAQTKEQYKTMIQSALDGKLTVTIEQKKDALMALYCQLKHYIRMPFTEANDVWMDWTIEEVNQSKGVDEIVDVIANNIPIIYNSIKKKLNRMQKED